MNTDAARQALEGALLRATDRVGVYEEQLGVQLPALTVDLKQALAAFREQASPDAALIEALEQLVEVVEAAGPTFDASSGNMSTSGFTPAILELAAHDARVALAAARAGETT